MNSSSSTRRNRKARSPPWSERRSTAVEIMRGASPRRPAIGGGAVLVHGAHGVEGGRDLPGDLEAREDGVDVGLLHREARGPEVVEGVAEGVDAVVVDVGDGAGDGEVEVALDEGDADRRAGLEVRQGPEAPRRRTRRRRGPGRSPGTRTDPGAHSKVAGSKPEKTRGKRERRSAPRPPGREGSDSPRKAPGTMARSGRSKAAAMASRSRGAARPSGPSTGRKRAEAARGVWTRVASIISAIGVMPGDRLLAEGEGVGHRAHELAVDEDRAAAHALDDPGLGEGAPARGGPGSGSAADPPRCRARPGCGRRTPRPARPRRRCGRCPPSRGGPPRGGGPRPAGERCRRRGWPRGRRPSGRGASSADHVSPDCASGFPRQTAGRARPS